jgi:1-pyrroline-5-carboxylate dehydrogenase
VINFVPGDPQLVTKVILENPHLAGIHYTGSTEVFRQLWKNLGDNISRYVNYPRLVGETGGKNFVFVHQSADTDAVVTALLRGAYEFSGQKCSAASRAYVPASMWKEVKAKLIEGIKSFKVGNPEEVDTMVGPVIHRASFDRCKSFIDLAKSQSNTYNILAGGVCDDSKGYFVHPTLVETNDPHGALMEKEIFGPILTVYPFADDKIDDALLLAEKSAYGLTGSIFSNDRHFITKAISVLEYGCGNLYINDKPTGAVVGQQPFGGSRASGTNDKAGGKHNLLRFVNVRSIKENFIPDTTPFYPYMSSKQ